MRRRFSAVLVRSDAAIDIFGQAGYHRVAKFDKKEELVSCK
jgi:hypothetical protein